MQSKSPCCPTPLDCALTDQVLGHSQRQGPHGLVPQMLRLHEVCLHPCLKNDIDIDFDVDAEMRQGPKLHFELFRGATPVCAALTFFGLRMTLKVGCVWPPERAR